MPDQKHILGLHLATLAGFAISQPLFDILRRYPTFLVSHQLDSGAILLLVAGLGAGVPGMLFVLGWIASYLRPRVHATVHLLAISLLTFGTILPLTHRGGAPAAVALPLAAVLATLFTLAYVRAPRVRSFVGLLSLALVAFPLLFLSSAPVRTLAFGGHATDLATVEIEGETPVVLLIFDEFPVTSLLDTDRQVDALRYPHFADLAARSHWFRNASTVAAFTEQAVPAILTGSWPEGDRIPHYEEYPRSLYTLLGRSYDVHALEPTTMLLPPDLGTATDPAPAGNLLADLAVVYLHVLLPSDLSRRLPSIEHGWTDFGAGDEGREQREAQLATQTSRRKRATQSRVDLALAYISRISTMGPRTLHVMHVMLPHNRWRHAPSGRHYCRKNLRNPGLEGDIWSATERYSHLAWQRHLVQVALADRLLGRVTAELRQAGLYDRALVVATADHGAGFWPSEPFRYLEGNSHPSDILDVPLFVKLPGQTVGEVTDRHVRTIDILPTIADVLGIGRIPWADGRSVFDPAADPPAVKRARDDEDPAYREFDADPATKYETLDRMHALLGSGDTSLHAVGEHREWLGLRTETLAALPTGPWEIRPDAGYFRNTAKEGKFVALFVTGRVNGPTDVGPLSVAVAVNGVVEAVARTVPIDDTRADFHLVLPEEACESGPMEIELFLLDESADPPRFLDGQCDEIRFHQKPIPAHYLPE